MKTNHPHLAPEFLYYEFAKARDMYTACTATRTLNRVLVSLRLGRPKVGEIVAGSLGPEYPTYEDPYMTD